MQKFDYSKELKTFYKPSAKTPTVVDVPEWWFLQIDGHGNPNSEPRFGEAVEALYALSYAIKFHIKKKLDMDYRVRPLEGLWWADNMGAFVTGNKDDWNWTVMIAQPAETTPGMVETARQQVADKKELNLLQQIRFQSYVEGTAAQIMHIGPFEQEAPTIEKVHQFIIDQGGKLAGKHHEIYLSDIRRAAPEKWKTIIRQPFVLP